MELLKVMPEMLECMTAGTITAPFVTLPTKASFEQND
jgi:hypothetical protein